MVVFSGKRPENKNEIIDMVRGINDCFCFYDDLSLKEQCRLDGRSYLLALLKKLF